MCKPSIYSSFYEFILDRLDFRKTQLPEYQENALAQNLAARKSRKSSGPTECFFLSAEATMLLCPWCNPQLFECYSQDTCKNENINTSKAAEGHAPWKAAARGIDSCVEPIPGKTWRVLSGQDRNDDKSPRTAWRRQGQHKTDLKDFNTLLVMVTEIW